MKIQTQRPNDFEGIMGEKYKEAMRVICPQDEEMKTVPVGIGQLVGEYRIDWAQLMAASLYALIPLTIIFIFFNRYFVSGLSAGAVKE